MNDMTPPATMADPETRLRAEWANSLALCISEFHPDDAVQIMTAALQDMTMGAPSPAFSHLADSLRDDAEQWLAYVGDLEAQIYLDAIARHVAGRVVGIAARKHLMASIWNGLSQADKDGFLARFGRVAV